MSRGTEVLGGGDDANELASAAGISRVASGLVWASLAGAATSAMCPGHAPLGWPLTGREAWTEAAWPRTDRRPRDRAGGRARARGGVVCGPGGLVG